MTAPTRPATLRAADPLAMIIGGVVAIAAATGALAWLGLEAEQVVVIESAVLSIAAAIRTWLERRHDREVGRAVGERG